MELSLDIFKNDAFSVSNLYRVVDNATYVPTLLGSMGIFEPVALDTDKVILYEEDSTVHLIPSTERGAPDITQTRDQGRMFALKTPRLSKIDSVRGSELLGIANMALPESIRLRNAAELTAKRTSKLKGDLEMTKEFHRLGAVQGITYDADGVREIYNPFTTFGIAAPTVVDIDFATITDNEFMMYIQSTFYTPMRVALKERWTPSTRIVALVGDLFWQKLLTHPAIWDIWKLREQGRAIADGASRMMATNQWEQITFGGVTFVNYRGTDDGTTIAVGSDEAKFFPVGARDVFKVWYAPGETLVQVQEKGRPQYLMIQPDTRTEIADHVDIYVRSYALYACIFPKALMAARIAP
jgi:hypothetical protein